MRRIFIVVIGCLFASMAFANIEKSLSAEGINQVTVENVRGQILVVGSDDLTVSISGQLDSLAKEFIFTKNGDEIWIKIVLESSRRLPSGSGTNLVIKMPAQLKLRFQGVSTDLKAENLTGGMDIQSTSGNVELKNATGNIHVQNVSGNIQIADLAATLDLSNISGDIQGSAKSGKLKVQAISGDVSLTLEELVDVEVSSVSGDLAIKGTLNKDAQVTLSTVSGESILDIQEDLDALITLQTGPGGDIINRLNKVQPSSSFIGDQSLNLTVGNGNAKVSMSTVSGTLEIR